MHWLTEGELPEILRPEEEEKWLGKLGREEDEKAREVLILHNLRLVAWISEKYYGGAEREDLMSVGTIGLIKAVRSFDPGFQRRVSTYASRCIENEIRMYLRKKKKIQETEVSAGLACVMKDGAPDSLPEDFRDAGRGNPDVGRPASLGDPVGEEAVSNVAREEVKKAIKLLPVKDREFLELRYGMGEHGKMGKELSQLEVARKTGISQSCVSRKERKILIRLRNQLS